MLHYEFIRNALIISVLISILCPAIGIFLVLRRHSMIGDTLSHSSLAGVAVGLMFGANPIMGAFVAASVCGLLIESLRYFYKKYAELILVIVMSLSVGIAITVISSGRAHANVESFLFGSILTVTTADVFTVLVLVAISFAVILFFFNRLIFITFDEEGARVSGVHVQRINYLFSIIVSATIAVSIHIVGVLVLSSMIAIPVATALQFNRGFKTTLLLSIGVGFVDVISSIFASFYLDAAPGGLAAIFSVVLLIGVISLKKLIRAVHAPGAFWCIFQRRYGSH